MEFEPLRKGGSVLRINGKEMAFDHITISDLLKKLDLSEDGVSEGKIGCGLMAPRVSIVANHQANTVARIILGEKEV